MNVTISEWRRNGGSSCESWAPGECLQFVAIAAQESGRIVAPHQQVIAEVVSLRSPFTTCGITADLADRAASYISRVEQERMQSVGATPCEGVFIGHGRSPLWRDLKDFVHERVGLHWDEFNRVPVNK